MHFTSQKDSFILIMVLSMGLIYVERVQQMPVTILHFYWKYRNINCTFLKVFFFFLSTLKSSVFLYRIIISICCIFILQHIQHQQAHIGFIEVLLRDKMCKTWLFFYIVIILHSLSLIYRFVCQIFHIVIGFESLHAENAANNTLLNCNVSGNYTLSNIIFSNELLLLFSRS